MSYVSLAADAERMHLALWHLPRERRYKKTAAELRTELVARLYGPGHPGFKGKLADIDAHLTRLVDCRLGRYGRALQIAINAHEAAQRDAAELARMTTKRRPNKAEVTFQEADVRRWVAVSRAAHVVYRAARAVRSEDDLGILPTAELADCTVPWPIPKPLAVNSDAETLVAVSREAIRVARIEVDTAPRRPVVQVPGFEQLAEAHTVPLMLVVELGRFLSKLESQTTETA